jgi:hypothetical protein
MMVGTKRHKASKCYRVILALVTRSSLESAEVIDPNPRFLVSN